MIKLDTDRRLGHEWDDWDGGPLENGGDFSAPARLYFGSAAAGLLIVALVLSAIIYLLSPRLAQIAPILPRALAVTLVSLVAIAAIWLALLALSFFTGRAMLPPALAERGLMLRTMHLATRAGTLFGVRRDRTEHASVEVYDRLALARHHAVNASELLILIPRCLSRDALDGVLDVANRYGVAAFVATRGQLARRVIRERRPKAVVAVACERDMVSGLYDVAGRVPVLGLTMTLPNGPCKDAALDLVKFESFVKVLTERQV
ncbi:MAG: DUF116 domain-containing protein [Gemmatimonadota bacterium]|nr:DUF116 domain-containing protein [Gemmatimonadota bacterium]